MNRQKLFTARWRATRSETKASRAAAQKTEQDAPKKPKEIGGPDGPEPTRYGDWERKGRCIDF
jgi:hypothetical protein